jgi:LacI family transcriptional regulator
VIGVARELTASTRDALLRGDLAAVLSHPLTQLAQGLVGQMIEVLDNPGLGLQQLLVPLDTQTPESC